MHDPGNNHAGQKVKVPVKRQGKSARYHFPDGLFPSVCLSVSFCAKSASASACTCTCTCASTSKVSDQTGPARCGLWFVGFLNPLLSSH